MTMRVTLSEFLGMQEWNNEEICKYVDSMNEQLKQRDDLIRDILYDKCCRTTCADCPHEGDDGCDFVTRALDMGVVIWE